MHLEKSVGARKFLTLVLRGPLSPLDILTCHRSFKDTRRASGRPPFRLLAGFGGRFIECNCVKGVSTRSGTFWRSKDDRGKRRSWRNPKEEEGLHEEILPIKRLNFGHQSFQSDRA
ncbi:hypothetical protein Nepgr_013332 [Nepenthes gracilis]|uniref:Uncharacterized protein n=1 Tax=Nepenthes gracilis TaxID=150966 RepID=A0AAD3XP76_NEPGR|nr:hypothetical protein Nepgr_013332 [Nepenthes gracilis]